MYGKFTTAGPISHYKAVLDTYTHVVYLMYTESYTPFTFSSLTHPALSHTQTHTHHLSTPLCMHESLAKRDKGLGFRV